MKFLARVEEGPCFFGEQDAADIADEDEGGWFEDGEALEEFDGVGGDELEGEDGETDAGVDGPHDEGAVRAFFAEADGGDDIVDAEAEVHEADLDEDGGQADGCGGGFDAGRLALVCGGGGFVGFVAFGEVGSHEIDKVACAEPAYPCIADEPCGCEEGEDAEEVGTGHAEADGFFLFLRREVAGERGDAEHIIHGEEAFDEDEAGDDCEAVEDFLVCHEKGSAAGKRREETSPWAARLRAASDKIGGVLEDWGFRGRRTVRGRGCGTYSHR